jgi:hypothetical protein
LGLKAIFEIYELRSGIELDENQRGQIIKRLDEICDNGFDHFELCGAIIEYVNYDFNIKEAIELAVSSLQLSKM